MSVLLGPPDKEILAPVNLLLELKDAIEQCLSSGRASRDVDVDRDNPVAAANNRV